VWDLATGVPVGIQITGHAGPVTALAMTDVAGQAVVIYRRAMGGWA